MILVFRCSDEIFVMTKINKKKFKNILDMSHSEARVFFLKHESYCNLSLPKYFKFDKLLGVISKKIDGKKLSSFYKNKKENHPKKYDDINHAMLHNKDGKYAWRRFELINPVFYVALVHSITDKKNWEIIVCRFKEFKKNKKIKCISLPIESFTNNSDKAEKITQWWHDVEQQSIKYALDYECIVKTDITDCYGAIYTHSIAWALHDKVVAKRERNNKNLIGIVIDDFLCDMSNGQTNGIPQGSTLTDFIAEIVLGYADKLLFEKIKNEVKKYHIIRYRDDYRIFVHNASDGDLIVRYLCEVLIDLGLKLNPTKTISSQNIVEQAIKEDKRFWFSQKQYDKDYQKHLLIIHDLSGKYPNSGSLKKALDDYYKVIKDKKTINNTIVLISIIVDIAYNNPNTYPESAAILSKLISCIKGNKKKLAIFNKIKFRFKKIPNTEHLMIWLQRITLNIDHNYEYSEPLCKLISGESVNVWNFGWLNDNFNKIINVKSIVDYELIESLPEVIEQNEVALFESY